MGNSLSNIYSGFFSSLGTFHVHVDGGVAAGPVEDMVDRLNQLGLPSRLTLIRSSIPGPQRQESKLKSTYLSHTPGTGDEEKELEYFSTTRFESQRDAKRVLKQLLGEFRDEQALAGIVIEMERVIGRGEDQIEWLNPLLGDPPVIHSGDVGFDRGKTLPIEIHYSCDIPKGTKWRDCPPVDLARLLNESTKLGIKVGGWFLFEKEAEDLWAYRSNMFAKAPPNFSKELVQKQRNELARRLSEVGAEVGFNCRVGVLVEQALGVWKTPLRRRYEFKTVRELAEWERSFRNLRKFWVISPDFLGDVDLEVRHSMYLNLCQGAVYTYFLRSFGDCQRLRKLARSLQAETPKHIDVFKLIKPVLHVINKAPQDSSDDNFDDKEYFVAFPDGEDPDAYQLVRSEEGEIIEGIRLKPSEVERIVEDLEPFASRRRTKYWMQVSVRLEAEKEARAILYSGLKDCAATRETLGEADWERVLTEYDLIVAEEVSKLRGEVVKHLGDGYLIIFGDAAASVRCAGRMQAAVKNYNANLPSCQNRLSIPPQRIAVDFGSVAFVVRSHGFDVSGELVRCAKLLEGTPFNQVYITEFAYEMAKDGFSEEERKRTFSEKFSKSFDLGEYYCREIEWKIN